LKEKSLDIGFLAAIMDFVAFTNFNMDITAKAVEIAVRMVTQICAKYKAFDVAQNLPIAWVISVVKRRTSITTGNWKIVKAVFYN
jgi:hypothetical protein